MGTVWWTSVQFLPGINDKECVCSQTKWMLCFSMFWDLANTIHLYYVYLFPQFLITDERCQKHVRWAPSNPRSFAPVPLSSSLTWLEQCEFSGKGFFQGPRSISQAKLSSHCAVEKSISQGFTLALRHAVSQRFRLSQAPRSWKKTTGL